MKIMKLEVLKTLRDLLPEQDFTQNVDFIKEGMIDSFDLVLLVSELDKKFGISIDGMDIIPENFSSLGQIVELLNKNGAEKWT